MAILCAYLVALIGAGASRTSSSSTSLRQHGRQSRHKGPLHLVALEAKELPVGPSFSFLVGMTGDMAIISTTFLYSISFPSSGLPSQGAQ